MQVIVYTALGSNIGDRRSNLQQAIRAVWEVAVVRRSSRVYETKPWGCIDQRDFLNQALEIETNLDPLSLLDEFKSIEARMGRQPTFRNGPRLIDIDILLYADWVLEDERLVIPHPRMHMRAFVLAPLAELAPDICHPVSGRRIADLLQTLDTSGVNPV